MPVDNRAAVLQALRVVLDQLGDLMVDGWVDPQQAGQAWAGLGDAADLWERARTVMGAKVGPLLDCWHRLDQLARLHVPHDTAIRAELQRAWDAMQNLT